MNSENEVSLETQIYFLWIVLTIAEGRKHPTRFLFRESLVSLVDPIANKKFLTNVMKFPLRIPLVEYLISNVINATNYSESFFLEMELFFQDVIGRPDFGQRVAIELLQPNISLRASVEALNDYILENQWASQKTTYVGSWVFRKATSELES